MESIKHYFANTLNFDDKFYKGMDQAIVFFFEAYVSMQDEYAKK